MKHLILMGAFVLACTACQWALSQSKKEIQPEYRTKTLSPAPPQGANGP